MEHRGGGSGGQYFIERRETVNSATPRRRRHRSCDADGFVFRTEDACPATADLHRKPDERAIECVFDIEVVRHQQDDRLDPRRGAETFDGAAKDRAISQIRPQTSRHPGPTESRIHRNHRDHGRLAGVFGHHV